MHCERRRHVIRVFSCCRAIGLFLALLLWRHGMAFVARPAATPLGSAGLWTKQVSSAARAKVAVAASATVVPSSQQPPLAAALKGKTGKAGGDDGGGPTDAERLQVLSYRIALALAALSWIFTYTLDFFMTSGVNIIDPGLQKSALDFADLCAGVAALVAPTGSVLVLGAVLKIFGLSAIACVVLGATGAAKVGSLLGPICVALICVREAYWFGLANRADAAVSALLFIIVAVLRGNLVITGIDFEAGKADTGTNARDISGLRENELQWLSRWQELELPPYSGSVPPVGPPLPISFFISSSLTVTSFGKALSPIGEDLDEEGEQFFKRSSGPIKPLDEDA